ncbi:MAG TPA: F0F1 ATP synthase subunit epsilon, partial [Candidatus Polarisedimenticolia bacterium]|nr:F0F1 ATP synthase subunit epsilon [Candidatus Polarisedimenticolia bacterium]
MPPETLRLDVVTPERVLVAESVDEVILPGSQGSFGVLPGHAPLLTDLDIGPLVYRRGQERRELAVAGGFVEVLPDRVTVLAEVAEAPEEIDVARAEQAKERAEQRLKTAAPDTDYERAQQAMRKALLRAEVGKSRP